MLGTRMNIKNKKSVKGDILLGRPAGSDKVSLVADEEQQRISRQNLMNIDN